MKKLFILFILFLLFETDKLIAQNNKTGNGFIENKGQIVDQSHKPNSEVKFLLSNPGFNIQLRQTGFSYDTYTVTKDSTSLKDKFMPIKGKHKTPDLFIKHYHRVDIELTGCNPHAPLIAEDKSQVYYNYLNSSAPNGGVSEVHHYQKITYRNIYPNIDLEFLSKPDENTAKTVPVEYQFIVHSGGRVSDIKLSYKGANKIKLIENKLAVSVTAGDFMENIPSSYLKDDQQPVEIHYSDLGNNEFQFSVPPGTKFTSDLIIDPTPCLQWGTYFAGNDNADGLGMTIDSVDNVYTTGYTQSTNIATAGAYQTVDNGGEDAYVAKFNPTGTTLLWCTYLGGTGNTLAIGIAVDKAQNVYFTGGSNCATGIATKGAYDTVFTGTSGNGITFVAKLNTTGTSLYWCTYYGGAGRDQGETLAIDDSDNVYVGGPTESTTGIYTKGAYQTTVAGMYVAKFKANGKSLMWGTYYGITNDAGMNGIAADRAHNVYVTGSTGATSGISTSTSYLPTYGGGGYVGFVAKFNPNGSGLVWGTYIGANYTRVGGIVIDANNYVYIVGETSGTTAIATASAYQTTYSGTGGNYCIFVDKLDSSGSSLSWGTYYGGTNSSFPFIAMDKLHNLYITGQTASKTDIATPNAYQSSFVGSSNDAFVAKFNPSGTSLLWGTYYGGGAYDTPNGIAVDSVGNVFIAGYTSSTNNIATPGAYQTTFAISSQDFDEFVARFGCGYCALTAATISASKTSICAGDTTTISVIPQGTTSVKYLWTPGGQTTQTIHVSPASNTTYSVTITDSIGGCHAEANIAIAVHSVLTITPAAPSICIGNSSPLIVSGASTYIWNPSGSLNASTGASITATPTVTTKYLVLGTDVYGCTSKDSATVVVNPLPNGAISSATTKMCTGNSITLSTNGTYTTYSWSPATGLNSTTVSSPVASPTVTTTYTVNITSSYGCKNKDSVTLTVVAKPLPTVTAIPSTISICSGDTTMLQAGGALTYAWSPTTGLNTILDSIVKAHPTTTTKYTVTGTDANGCFNTVSSTVTVITTPVLTLTTSVSTICLGDSAVLKVSGATSYIWTPDSALSATTGASVLAKPDTTQTYSVTGTQSGCNSAPKTITIAVTPTPVIIASASPILICPGSTSTLIASNASTYTWSPATGLNTTTGNSVSASPGNTITYTVTGTKPGCVNKGMKTVAVAIEPSPVLTVTGNSIICAGNSTRLNSSGAKNYKWFPSTGLNTTADSVVIANPSSTTTYTIAGTDSLGCTTIKTTKITVTPTNGFDLTGNLYVCIDTPKNNNVSIQACIYNSRCMLTTGTLKLVLDTAFHITSTVSDSVARISGDTLMWNYDNLSDIGKSNCVSLAGSVSNIPAGDSVFVSMFITPTLGDSVPANNSVTYWVKAFPYNCVGLPFDPNEKSVLPEGNISATQQLSYTIHFQNTGTAVAKNVVVIDTLSPYVDPTTLKVTSASSEVSTSIVSGNIVKFTFDNINLPDTASSKTTSIGVFKYTIDPAASAAPGDVIYNGAGIYFDANPIVKTNTTKSPIVGAPLSVNRISTSLNIACFPNPFTTTTSIVFNTDGTHYLELDDVTGRKVESIECTGRQYELQRNNLAAGVYFIKAFDAEHAYMAVQKVVVQ
jgi:uncharacterized repeat protein (TIGR01451 family)